MAYRKSLLVIDGRARAAEQLEIEHFACRLSNDEMQIFLDYIFIG